MRRFTRNLEFAAFQFNPEALQDMDDYDIEDAVVEALGHPDGAKSAFVTEDGKLDIVLYTPGLPEPKEYHTLNPGDWLTNIPSGEHLFTVFSGAEFNEFATAVR